MLMISLMNVNAGIPVPPGQHGGESKVCVQMENSDNMQYVIPIQVGAPGQKMMAIPDTGSFELVVPSTECGSGCTGHPLFNSSSSTSFLYRGSTQVIHYGQGDVTTEVDYDTVTMAGMQVTHQSLLQMTYNGLENYDLAIYDAVMGLGLSELARPNDDDLSLLASMSEKVFGICLGQHDNDPGRLDLGRGIPELEDQYTSLPCSKDTGHWGLQLSGFKVGSTDITVGSNGMDMIVDSGTSLLALPTEVYEKVLSTIDPVEEDCSNIDSLPDLEMSVGDYKFVIPPQLYVGKVKLDEAERGATLLQDRTWGPFRFRGSDKHKAAQRAARRAAMKAGFASQRNVSLLQDIKSKDHSSEESYLGGPSDGVCLPLFMELNVFTDNGALFILGMPFLRAYSVRFDLSKQTIGLKKLPLGSSMCASCASHNEGGGGGGGGGKHGKNRGGISSLTGGPSIGGPHGGIHSLLPETPGRRVGPVGINLKKLRLPWWAVHQSVPRNSSHSHPSGRRMAQSWRHFKRR
jgi:hypothetical protein